MPTAALIAVSGVFVMVALVAGSTALWWMERSAPEHQRLRALVSNARSGLVRRTRGPLTEGPDETLSRLTRLVPRSPKDMSRLQRRLARAGYPQFKSAVYYSIVQLALPAVLGLATLLVFGLGSWLYALLAAALGYVLPGFYIGRKITLRQKAIRNGLPDALDLLTVCVEAGSGLDQAIVKASEELQIAHPALAVELRIITTEVRAGKSRMEAFKNFAKRTGVDDVRTLVAMLVQTDRFGTSVAQALRTHAETSRTRRRQEAEERAAKVSVKLVFPLAFCLFPALYAVCFGPVVVQIYRGLLSTN
jgi:tight adherence protein C